MGWKKKSVQIEATDILPNSMCHMNYDTKYSYKLVAWFNGCCYRLQSLLLMSSSCLGYTYTYNDVVQMYNSRSNIMQKSSAASNQKSSKYTIKIHLVCLHRHFAVCIRYYTRSNTSINKNIVWYKMEQKNAWNSSSNKQLWIYSYVLQSRDCHKPYADSITANCYYNS